MNSGTGAGEDRKQSPAKGAARLGSAFWRGSLFSPAPAVHPFMNSTQLLPGFTPATVFRGLQSDVTTVRGFQGRVNVQNGNNQAPQLDVLVTDYRW